METEAAQNPTEPPKWRPLSAIDRRVVGVLVEKAKTTPDQYPLTLNALRTGCNQKSNRFPAMQLEADQVEESLERLRHAGAVIEVQESGRVSKYRHRMYEWLGLDKVELAVIAELLLRGAQTIGELRGRAARMEPIADLGALRPLLDTLRTKQLITYLTSEGRGAIVTHTLYTPSELERLRQEYGRQGGATSEEAAPPAAARAGAAHQAAAIPSGSPSEAASLRAEIADCRGRIDELEQTCARLQAELDDLRRQLGA